MVKSKGVFIKAENSNLRIIHEGIKSLILWNSSIKLPVCIECGVVIPPMFLSRHITEVHRIFLGDDASISETLRRVVSETKPTKLIADSSCHSPGQPVEGKDYFNNYWC